MCRKHKKEAAPKPGFFLFRGGSAGEGILFRPAQISD